MAKKDSAKKLKNHPYFTYEIWGNDFYDTYASLARYHATMVNPNIPFVRRQQIKSAAFRDLRMGVRNIHDLFEEHKEKQQLGADFCWYCNRPTSICGKLEAEHILPKSKGGYERMEGNIAYACHDCNTKKGTKDFILWYTETFDVLPPLMLLRIYLKNVYQYSVEKELMSMNSEDIEKILTLPFSPQSMGIIRKYLKDNRIAVIE